MFKEFLKDKSLSEMLACKRDRAPFPKAKNRESWNALSDNIKAETAENARRYSKTEYPLLRARDFIAFVSAGSRVAYEKPYFERRKKLIAAIIHECVFYDKSRLDEIIDGLWLICEETFWGISAHNASASMGVSAFYAHSLPEKDDPYIDLLAAQTGATLSLALSLLSQELDEVTPLITRRVKSEVLHRIIEPFLHRDDFWWMGVTRKDINNWTPWIVSNVLVSASICEDDDWKLQRVISRAMEMLDRYIDTLPFDGGCDEGVGYWNMAGGSLLDCLEHIYRLTGGKVNLYDDEKIKAIGMFPVRAHISGEWFWNFADCDAKPKLDAERLYTYGTLTNQSALKNLGCEVRTREESVFPSDTPEFYRVLCKVFAPKFERSLCDEPAIGSCGLEVFAKKAGDIYAAMKGGNNNESHNHNDLGEFIVYYRGEPVFVDAGNMTYTALTFSDKRYTLWNTRSMNHSVPVINGFEQISGSKAAAENVTIESDGISMQLRSAYPEEAGAASYLRSMRFCDSKVMITDKLSLNSESEVEWVFIVREKPDIKGSQAYIAGLKLSFPYGMKYSVSEIPVTDGRMAHSFPGSLWRLALSDGGQSEYDYKFIIEKA